MTLGMVQRSITRHLPAVLAAALGATLLVAPHAAEPAAAAPERNGRLTNLAHLDYLGARVTPPAQSGHTTYRLAREPSIGTLWTYADLRDDGTYDRVGGGAYDPATDTWGQGAFNADDVTRAAVVYLRDWQQTRRDSSRRAAYDLLRGVTYHQTATGPDAGNVVLWMQPDGTLNPSAEPPEEPDPSDSDASYWLARTIWALGEGYAAFRREDPAFARFLRQRLDLAVDALRRQVLDKYGEYLDIDGVRTPAWLVVDGADASAEAVLGLAAYVRAGGGARARTALRQLSAGIAEMGDGTATQWPYAGVRPWGVSLSVWHAWASQMPAALASASEALGDRSLATVAARDSFTFDPWLLTSGGPDNGRLPTRIDRVQIAYGVDSRVQSLLATARTTGRDAGADLAGLTAGWYFGANASGQPTYDPATGITFDGVAGDGTVNRNSGAESTIHGLLSMLALDASPRAAAIARSATTVVDRLGTTTLEAEDATLAGDATAVTPANAWTGESQYGGGRYVEAGNGGTVTFARGDGPAARVIPVTDLRRRSTAVTEYRSSRTLGRVRSGDVGAQGDSPAPGALLPSTLPRSLPAGPATVTASTSATGGEHALIDALMLEPEVSHLVLGGDRTGIAVVRSAADHRRRTTVAVPGTGQAVVSVFDGLGRPVSTHRDRGTTVAVTLPAGGFALVRR